MHYIRVTQYGYVHLNNHNLTIVKNNTHMYTNHIRPIGHFNHQVVCPTRIAIYIVANVGM